MTSIWRERLFGISLLIRSLNEAIARQANFEGKCIGYFWEGRFKSQAQMNEKALMACMDYVALAKQVKLKVADMPAYRVVLSQLVDLPGVAQTPYLEGD